MPPLSLSPSFLLSIHSSSYEREDERTNGGVVKLTQESVAPSHAPARRQAVERASGQSVLNVDPSLRHQEAEAAAASASDRSCVIEKGRLNYSTEKSDSARERRKREIRSIALANAPNAERAMMAGAGGGSGGGGGGGGDNVE